MTKKSYSNTVTSFKETNIHVSIEKLMAIFRKEVRGRLCVMNVYSKYNINY
jgi:hypothetical protein